MYYPPSDTPAQARTSDLNEELGMIDYIFSDKTGTLTQNIMEFRRCSIGGKIYGDPLGEITQEAHESGSMDGGFVWTDTSLQDDMAAEDAQARNIKDVMLVMALCHTVIPERDRHDGEKIVYQAASPDEGALVRAAVHFGYRFTDRTPTKLGLFIHGKHMEVELLHTLEFSSNRKRMSVILRHPDGKIILYCKGADSVVYPRLGQQQQYGESTKKHLEEFGSEGLRTLCFATRVIPKDEYSQFDQLMRYPSPSPTPC
jgi:phospholipid-transporting ATPase